MQHDQMINRDISSPNRQENNNNIKTLILKDSIKTFNTVHTLTEISRRKK